MTTNDSSSSWRDQLDDVLEEQHAIVNELRGLAERQEEHIRAHRTDALLSLLGRRQELIDRFTRSQQALTALTDGLDPQRESLTENEKRRIRERIDAIAEDLNTVLRQDEHDQVLLEKGRQDTKDELSGMNQARTARNAYQGGAPMDARFADRQG